jgi:hypothetical protein
VNFQRASNPLPTSFQPFPTGVFALSPIPPGALERAPSWKGRFNAGPEGQPSKGKPDTQHEKRTHAPAPGAHGLRRGARQRVDRLQPDDNNDRRKGRLESERSF